MVNPPSSAGSSSSTPSLRTAGAICGDLAGSGGKDALLLIKNDVLWDLSRAVRRFLVTDIDLARRTAAASAASSNSVVAIGSTADVSSPASPAPLAKGCKPLSAKCGCGAADDASSVWYPGGGRDKALPSPTTASEAEAADSTPSKDGKSPARDATEDLV